MTEPAAARDDAATSGDRAAGGEPAPVVDSPALGQILSRAPDLHPHNVVIDCADHAVVVPFWEAALGWSARRINDQFVALRPPAGSDVGFAILFQQVPEPKVAKNRAHIDFDAGDMLGEVDRLVALGGRKLAEHSLGDFRWTIVADPEGNEFCVTVR